MVRAEYILLLYVLITVYLYCISCIYDSSTSAVAVYLVYLLYVPVLPHQAQPTIFVPSLYIDPRPLNFAVRLNIMYPLGETRVFAFFRAASWKPMEV